LGFNIVRFQKNIICLRFEIVIFLHFQIAILKKKHNPKQFIFCDLV
jgi:hypothetical protein